MNMLKLSILQVGKTKDANLEALVLNYQKRLRSSMKLEMLTVKNEAQAWEAIADQAFLIQLDVKGKQMDSEELAGWIEQRKNQGDSHLIFFIGPADGFKMTGSKKPGLTLSLSRMTFSHQTVRLLLLEQIYRASCILEGKPFPR